MTSGDSRLSFRHSLEVDVLDHSGVIHKPEDQAGWAHAGTQAALMAASTCLAQVGMGVPGPKIPAAPAW